MRRITIGNQLSQVSGLSWVTGITPLPEEHEQMPGEAVRKHPVS